MRFHATNALGPGMKTNRAGKFDLSGKQKNGGSSEQAFAPSFLPSPEAKEKTKIQQKSIGYGTYFEAVFYLENTTR